MLRLRGVGKLSFGQAVALCLVTFSFVMFGQGSWGMVVQGALSCVEVLCGKVRYL